MADRPDVPTASPAIAAIDLVGLGEQLVTALVRVPFRRPWSGPAGVRHNLAQSVTREVVRSFMGYSSGLPIDEFRSVEGALDSLCKVVLTPWVRAKGVETSTEVVGGVPGIWYRPDDAEPIATILYLHGGGYVGTSPTMYAAFTAALARTTQCEVFVADYRLAPEFPFPAGVIDALAVAEALRSERPDRKLFLAGDSGGGGLAGSAVYFAEKAGHPPVGRADPVLARGRPDVGPAIGDRERVPRHPAVEHPDRPVPARRERHVERGVGDPGRRLGLATDLRGLGDRRDVPRCDPDPGRAPGEGPGPDRRDRGAGHVPRVPDPHAVGWRQSPCRGRRRRFRPANRDRMTEKAVAGFAPSSHAFAFDNDWPDVPVIRIEVKGGIKVPIGDAVQGPVRRHGVRGP